MIDELVAEHGEEHRQLIEAAIKFLDENESKWNLDVPMDRKEYIRCVMEYTKTTEA